MAPRRGDISMQQSASWATYSSYLKISIRYDVRLPDFSEYKTTTYDWFRSYPEAQGNTAT